MARLLTRYRVGLLEKIAVIKNTADILVLSYIYNLAVAIN